MKGTLKHIKEISVSINLREWNEIGAFGEVLKLSSGREITLWQYRDFDESEGNGFDHRYSFKSLANKYRNHHTTEDTVFLPNGLALTVAARKYLVGLAAERLAKYLGAREDLDKEVLEGIMLAKSATLESFLALGA